MHYEYITMSGVGIDRVKVASCCGPWPARKSIRTMGLIDLYQYIERAIKVDRDFHLHRQYIVQDDEIVIVDEFTGRLAEGRKWRDGIHQAIEAKEGIEVTVPTGQAARITVQDLFLRYHHLAGMTGTAIITFGIRDPQDLSHRRGASADESPGHSRPLARPCLWHQRAKMGRDRRARLKRFTRPVARC